MRKASKVAVPFLAMLVGISLLASPAEPSFWLKESAFHYSPDYGDLKKGLVAQDPFYETPKHLGPGTGAAFSVGYDFSGNWGLRLDSFTFIGTADYHHKRLSDVFTFQTSTSPVILSVIYRIPIQDNLIPYLAAGIGSFLSKLTIQANIPGREFEETDSPIGFQLLTGAEIRFENGLFLSGELGYLSAKAKYPGYRCLKSCSTDWSGVFAGIGVGLRF